MLTRESQYDDLKVLFISNGFMTEDEDCGYDDYLFAVRKQWLLENLKEDGIETEEDLERWLREEYTSDESYFLYQKALIEREIVFERPVYCHHLKFYEVKERVHNEEENEERVFCRTMDYETAKRVYQEQYDKLMKDIAAGDFFMDGYEKEEECDPSNAIMSIEFHAGTEPLDYVLSLGGVEVETFPRKME